MPQEAISLSELCYNVKEAINGKFTEMIWVRAEIAEFRENRNGHCYLDLIEKQSDTDQIAARVKSIIWSYTYRMLKPYFETTTGRSLSDGLKVLALVSVEFHEVYGLSLVINDIDAKFTLGDLELRKREIISLLHENGVIEMNKELPFPVVPQRIAVISSATAAGFGDFTAQLENNQYGIKFYWHLFPAIMQGEQAPASIISAFDKIFENRHLFDVVVLIRGGGATIDLLCFDDYDVAYYITQFPLPVLTGIGHDRDSTIADMVAFKTLKTPTAVAEFLIKTTADFLKQIEEYKETLKYLLEKELDKKSQILTQITNKTINKVKQEIFKYQSDLKIKREKLVFFTNSYLKNRKRHLEYLEKEINMSNPAELLKKGYSLTYYKGKILKHTSQIKHGDFIKTKLIDGEIDSVVEKKIEIN